VLAIKWWGKSRFKEDNGQSLGSAILHQIKINDLMITPAKQIKENGVVEKLI
tara:strand:- start:571 stop:726 length:156 start_codon:yes stop_codon:yes gene_type:complete